MSYSYNILYINIYVISVQFSPFQSLSRVRLFATPWIAARQASLSITNSRSSLRLMFIESVMPSSHLILCRPLLLLPPIPPSIRVFSNESTLRMRWPKCDMLYIQQQISLLLIQWVLTITVITANIHMTLGTRSFSRCATCIWPPWKVSLLSAFCGWSNWVREATSLKDMHPLSGRARMHPPAHPVLGLRP